jgi:hypothetical protein
MSVDETAGRGAGLLEFLGYVDDKGLMNPSTAKAYRAAAREVLSAVEGDEWPSFDLREADVDDMLQRFQVKAGMKYTPRSLSTYRSRFRSAVSMYLDYMKDPGAWRPTRPQPSRASSPDVSPRRARRADTAGPVTTGAAINYTAVAAPSEPGMQSYPFPIRREGGVVFATLILPTDLTSKEADRIAAHLKTLAIPEQLALPRPSHPDSKPDPPL